MGPGSIAFVGFSADGNDSLAFVTFGDIPAGTVIYFSDNEWSGSAFAANESVWSWTAPGDIAAGTVISMNGLGTGGTPGANLGDVTFENQGTRDIADANEVIYAFTGSPSDPTFLTALTNGQFAAGGGRGVLTNTGLTNNVDAIVLIGSPDIAAYTGPKSGLLSVEEYKALVFDGNNWTREGGSGDQSSNGGLDLPLPATPFAADAAAQRVGFATSSVHVTEGDNGETLLKLTVTRSGATAGAVSFSGSIQLDGLADSLDFGANPLDFAGGFADGEATTTITIRLNGDLAFEEDEDFGIRLDSVTSDSGKAYLGTADEVRATIANDDPIQYVGFATDSLVVSRDEGNDGAVTTFTFIVERSGFPGTQGEISFNGTIWGETADDGDFGGSMPVEFSGVIREGESFATITITSSGDSVLEDHERFLLTLQSVSSTSPVTTVISPPNAQAAGIIGNDEPFAIGAGDVITTPLTIGAGHELLVPNGATVSTGGDPAFTWVGGDAVLENHGLIVATRVLVAGSTAGDLVVNNAADGVLDGNIDIDNLQGGSLTINNDGAMEKIDLSNFTDRTTATINNSATGVITASGLLINGGGNLTVNNAGRIYTAAGGGIDFNGGNGNVLNNSGLIEAGAHAATGESGLTVFNAATGVMIGHNGSAVNMDNSADPEELVRITNYGRMDGMSANTSDSDGDAIDVDGLAIIDNYGQVRGLGHNGYHNGEPNVSEGIAMGGGEIYNYEGGEIYGYGRAIQIDNSGNASSFAAVTIVNGGLIQGDGQLPTGVTPEQVAIFAERIRGAEAINVVGNLDDLLVNTRTGEIIGGVKLGGGNDMLTNQGRMLATGGTAIDMGDGNDTVNLHDGSETYGTIVLGRGNDVLSSSAADDLVVDGGEGQDSIATGAGDDVVSGGAGIDLIHGGAGDDELDGGADNDQLRGGVGDDLLAGGAGDDLLIGGEGDDTLIGGEGIDTADFSDDLAGIVVDFAAGTVDGDISGADTFSGIEKVVGGLGNDRFLLSDGVFPGAIDGGAGQDVIILHGSGVLGAIANVETVELGGSWTFTEDAATRLVFQAGAQALTLDHALFADGGFAGLISGFGQEDTIRLEGIGATAATLGDGNLLTIESANGPLTLQLDPVQDFAGMAFSVASDGQGGTLLTYDEAPNQGNDVFTGDSHNNSFDGGLGDDIIKGAAGNDTLAGGDGTDSVDGGSGNDLVSGGRGDDTLKGGSGSDHVDGGSGNDLIDAGSDDDIVAGGTGNDTIDAGSGADRITGGAGDDSLKGGSGHDSFVFAAGFGHDTIVDFTTSGANADVIEFSASLFAGFGDAMAAATQVGADVVFTLDEGTSLTLAHTQLAALGADDFRFV